MRPHLRLRCFLSLVVLVLAVSPTHAGRPAPVSGSARGEIRRVPVGAAVESRQSACVIGVPGPASFPMYYLYPPNDQYYTLLDPASCECSGVGGLAPSVAHVQLDFPEACSIPIEVAIVEANSDDPNCPVPAPGEYLRSPITHQLTVEEPGTYDFALPLPSGACLTERAFLQVTFLTSGECDGLPGLMIDGAYCGCVAYNAWPGSGDPSDLCGVFPGSPVMYVEASCCEAVPALPRSWGQLKSTYR